MTEEAWFSLFHTEALLMFPGLESIGLWINFYENRGRMVSFRKRKRISRTKTAVRLVLASLKDYVKKAVTSG